MQPIPSGERVEVKYLLGKRNADLLVTGELISERGFYLDLIKLKFLFNQLMSSTPAQLQSKPSEVDENRIRQSLRRCSEETIQAALGFHQTRDKRHLKPLIVGILERYVDPELRPKLRESNLELRLVEDLALDSLTLMEIIILVEEVLIVSISNEAARALRTVEDVRAFAEANC